MGFINAIKSLYLSKNLFYGVILVILTFLIGSSFAFVLGVAKLMLTVLLLIIVTEVIQLFRIKQGVLASRDCPDKLSNGDENHVQVFVNNMATYNCRYVIIDELPTQFQSRDIYFKGELKAEESKTIQYSIHPFERGEYKFGNINIYISTFLHLINRRYQFDAGEDVKVYPSILQVKKYSFMAISNQLEKLGIKKIRKIGHNYEFDQIREFVNGDDVRSINWRATARANQLMVNQYQDEKSQEVYAIINKGRVMKMPFSKLTLLDHSINSALVMLNTALAKDDLPGLLTYNKEITSYLPASKGSLQISKILESLYKQETDFSEANYDKLNFWIRKKIKKRSLLFLYTNFEGIVSLNRELRHLKQIAKYHRLIVVIFKNVELNKLIENSSEQLSDIYTKAIATKFQEEKKLIIKKLHANGIDAFLTTPENLTVDSINKYLEIKARGLL